MHYFSRQLTKARLYGYSRGSRLKRNYKLDSYFPNYFQKIHGLCNTAENDFFNSFLDQLDRVKASAAKVIIAGNGGSAALSSHVAVDFTKTAGIRAVNFNEADLITCFANDYGYENWLSQAFLAYADQGDLAVLVSSSGQSKNILNAAKTASKIGMTVVTFSGFRADNPLRKLGDLNAWANSQEYNIIEMTHHIWLLALMDNYIERKK